ncbi:S1C family serine protease [Demequina sp.]|uniref:S1C family serine protease n=1 Tax=Demequina sp. TaxID=2050685 RepID=UPI003A8B3079
MSDQSFAPPGSASNPQPPQQSQQPQYEPQQPQQPVNEGSHPDLNATQPLPHGAAFIAGSDGVIRTGEPAHDATGYEPPAEPPQAERPVGKVRKSTVALILLASLIVGTGAGLGGAWIYDEFLDGAPSVNVATGDPVPREEGSIAAVAASVMPSVVSIEASVNGVPASTGSGFVMREDGYILTNNHVVEGADGLTVTMSDGSEFDAELVGATTAYDIAVLHIDADGLAPVTFADSDDVVVGDATIAVGSPLGLEGTVTTGIVSATHRPVTAGDLQSQAYIDAIQTDAAINPGNSGGPLLNAKGEVIGINSAIATLSNSTSTTGSIGLGFAINSNQAKRTAEQLIETGTATYPVIGVQLANGYVGEGVQVLDDSRGVVEGGPGDDAGILPGDIITGIDGRPITQSDELIVAIRAKAVGDQVVLSVERDGQELELTVVLDDSSEVVYNTTEPQPEE